MDPRKKDFINRLEQDLTYKSDLTEAQRQALCEVEDCFDQAARVFKTDLETVPDRFSHKVACHFDEGNKLLRKAQRKANAAIVNEWSDGYKSDLESTEGYGSDAVSERLEVESVRSTQQAQCHICSRLMKWLGVSVALIIPFGRQAALFGTLIEDARGEFLDGINDAYKQHRDASTRIE